MIAVKLTPWRMDPGCPILDRNDSLSHWALMLEMSLRETGTESALRAAAKIRK